jgi:hypothetical protein
MALREFRDANGVEWRVWATIPETSALVRVAYGPLGGLEAGWLTFECVKGRKRLAPVPTGWDTLSDAELERWCSEATAPPARRSRRDETADRDQAGIGAPIDGAALDPSTPARTFTGDRGRLWRVTEHQSTVRDPSNDQESRTVSYFTLRFTSESDVLELRSYPMAWSRLGDADLLELLRQAEIVKF